LITEEYRTGSRGLSPSCGEIEDYIGRRLLCLLRQYCDDPAMESGPAQPFDPLLEAIVLRLSGGATKRGAGGSPGAHPRVLRGATLRTAVRRCVDCCSSQRGFADCHLFTGALRNDGHNC
jgi:hypothetical protein